MKKNNSIENTETMEPTIDLDALTINLDKSASEALETRLNLGLCNVMGGAWTDPTYCLLPPDHTGRHWFGGRGGGIRP